MERVVQCINRKTASGDPISCTISMSDTTKEYRMKVRTESGGKETEESYSGKRMEILKSYFDYLCGYTD